MKWYRWDEPFLFKLGIDQILRRCIPYSETESILHDYHSTTYGGHYGGNKTAQKVLQAGFYWPTLFKDSHRFVMSCD